MILPPEITAHKLLSSMVKLLYYNLHSNDATVSKSTFPNTVLEKRKYYPQNTVPQIMSLLSALQEG